MNQFLIGAILGLILGFWMGNKKFRRSMNKAVQSFRNRKTEEWEEDDDD